MNPSKWIFAFQAVQSISPDEKQKSLCLADVWKLFWHPQARHKRQPEEELQDGQCPAPLLSSKPRQGREGELSAVNLCEHIREWCKHLICTVWDVISAGSLGKTF